MNRIRALICRVRRSHIEECTMTAVLDVRLNIEWVEHAHHCRVCRAVIFVRTQKAQSVNQYAEIAMGMAAEDQRSIYVH